MMEGLQKAFRAISENPKLAQLGMPSSSSSSSTEGGGAVTLSSNHSGVLITRPPRVQRNLCQLLLLLSSASMMKERTNSSISNLPLPSFLKPRQSVSLWTCSKLCTICFVVGVVAGFTLKRRVRRWASKLLRRIKDN